MPFFFRCIVLLLFTQPAWGLAVEGNIVPCSKASLCLQLKGRTESLSIVPRNEKAHQDLIRLSAGDYLVGYGHVSLKFNRVTMDSIDSVGLHRLYGKWRSEEGHIYYFIDHRTIEKCLSPCKEGSPIQIINYQVSPGKRPSWIFLMMDLDVLTGKLNFHDNSIDITFIGENMENPIKLYSIDN